MSVTSSQSPVDLAPLLAPSLGQASYSVADAGSSVTHPGMSTFMIAFLTNFSLGSSDLTSPFGTSLDSFGINGCPVVPATWATGSEAHVRGNRRP